MGVPQQPQVLFVDPVVRGRRVQGRHRIPRAGKEDRAAIQPVEHFGIPRESADAEVGRKGVQYSTFGIQKGCRGGVEILGSLVPGPP